MHHVPFNGKTDGIKTIKGTLEYFSQYVGEYPYDICQAITGPLKAGAGMEYPTITIVDDGGEQVIEHEVGHNWFYGILGSNERFFPWMDEGINSFYENRYFEIEGISKIGLSKALTGDYRVLNNPRLEHYATWLLLARIGRDQPIGLHSEQFSEINYAGIVYGKTALAFQELKDYLGDAIFDTAMHQYFSKWKFRHPLPGDLRQVLEESTGKNLSWFFDGSLGSRKIHDYRITKLKKIDAGHLEVTIKNRGQLAAPFRFSM
jgi:aminopeptidase N